jgi:hypothetical protein
MASTAAPTPGVSPIDAARDAVAYTRRHLFPFRFRSWLVLGFLAFLDQCGRSGWNSGVPSGGGRSHDGELPAGRGLADVVAAGERAYAWLGDHLGLVVAASLLGLLVLGALVALVLWINARGTFMYLDAVARGRAEVARPWREHALAADSYFTWRLGLAGAAVLAVVTALVLSGVIVVTLVRNRPDLWAGGAVALALSPIFLALLVALPALVLAGVVLRDFAAPLQLAGGIGCGRAVEVLERLVVAHTGAFVVYLLLKVVLFVVTGAVVLLAGCLSCCVGFLPIVCQTLLQPLFFFERAWPLFLLRQMGHSLPSGLLGQPQPAGGHEEA